MLKGLIIQPPYFCLRGSHNNRVNQGAHALLECLNEKAIETKLLNLDARDSQVFGTRYKIFKNTCKAVTDEFEDFDYSLLYETLDRLTPDFVIICAGDIITPTVDFGSFKHADYIAKKIKEQGYKQKIIAYGPFVDKSDNFDCIILGDAENVIFEIINNTSIKEITNETPADYFKLIPFFTDKNLLIPVDSIDMDCITSSRGCPFACGFCITPIICRQKVRYREPRHFVDEIAYRINEYRVNDFYFTDLLFTANAQHALNICEEIIRRKLEITWRCESRVDTCDVELIRKMKEAGCTYIKLGVESMNDRRLQFLNKKIVVAQIEHSIELIKRIGIKVIVYVLLGGKGFTTEDYLEEYEKFCKLGADKYTVSILNPYKNSQIYNELNWGNGVTDGVSHLDPSVVTKWNLSQLIVDKFFQLELSNKREDAGLRKYV